MIDPSILSLAEPLLLAPDPDRLLLRFFVAGVEDVGPGTSRAGRVIDRLMALDDARVDEAIEEIDRQFPEHESVWAAATHHLDLVASRMDDYDRLNPDRQRLIGAAFTHQFAVEGAALCNPSMVQAPNQTEDGLTSFVMSVRGIGEGHRSSIGFRTGHITASGAVCLEPSTGLVESGEPGPGIHHRRTFRRLIEDQGADEENVAFIFEHLETRFGTETLESRLAELADQALTRKRTEETIAQAHFVASSSYGVRFNPKVRLSQRVLWPRIATERHGMEDARFVRFTDDDGSVIYYATYTAFDGLSISMQLIETTDFVGFQMTPISGMAAVGKGLALFPRRIRGRYYALTRADRETNSLASSDDLTCWDASTPLQSPTETWEILQLGNCGSPIELPEGWLVLTHGVGAMRTYSMGALLLDLEDPAKVIGRTRLPLIRPKPGRGGGYVPNVVYSCGAMLDRDNLIIPFGVNDQSIAIASFKVSSVLERLEAD